MKITPQKRCRFFKMAPNILLFVNHCFIYFLSKKTSWLLLLLLLLQFIIIVVIIIIISIIIIHSFIIIIISLHKHPKKNSLHRDCTFQMLVNVGSCCRKVSLYTFTVMEAFQTELWADVMQENWLPFSNAMYSEQLQCFFNLDIFAVGVCIISQ